MEISTIQPLGNRTATEDLELQTTLTTANIGNWSNTDIVTNVSVVNILSLNSVNASYSSFTDSGEHVAAWVLYVIFCLNCLFPIFGFFGNVSSIIVMLQPPRKVQSYGLLVVVLAITDTFGLTANFFRPLSLPGILNSDVRTLTDTACTIAMMFDLTAKMYSSYIIVLICIDRFIAVQYPLQFKQIVSRKVRVLSLCICGCMCLLSGIVNAVMFSEIKNGVCQLGSSEQTTFIQRIVRFLFLSLFYVVIPMGIIISLTPVIIFKLKQQHAVRARLTAKDESSQMIRTSVMLISVVIAYIILVGVPSLVFFGLRLGGVDGNVSNDILIILVATAIQINHSTNICLYVISNKEFREKFLRLFGCSCKTGRSGIESDQVMPMNDRLAS